MPMISAAMSWSRIGDEGAADAAAHQVERRHDGEHGEEQQEEIEVALGVEAEAEQARPGDLDRGLRAARDRRHVVDGPFDDELAGQRGDGEIEALDAQARHADDRADQRRHQPARRQRDPERQVEPHREVGRRVGADRHEGAVADRDLPGVAHQDVEPQRADDGDEDQVQDRQVIFVDGERHDHDEQHRQHRHRPAGDRQRVERHVGGVGRLEDSGLAMEHGYTRSIWRLPKMP